MGSRVLVAAFWGVRGASLELTRFAVIIAASRQVEMTGTEYRQLLARYIVAMFGERGIKVYEEVAAGTTIIGKQRRLDLFIWEAQRNLVMAVECKYQDSIGTVDEKIPYALEDISQVPFPGIIAYAGRGFSEGVLHLLQSSARAAYCLPDESLLSVPRRLGATMDSGTWQLDHALAIRFGWWDVLVAGKLPVQYSLGRNPEADPVRQP
jgi:hypothetical protein